MMSFKREITLLFFVLLAFAVATPKARAQARATGLSDSQEAGSFLVFPLFETGSVTTADQGVLPKTSFEISARCPTGSTCTDGDDVDIRLEWVCSAGVVCSERNFVLTTTVNGTIRFDPTSSVCQPGGCGGFVQLPQCPEGYLVAWVIDESGNPIKFDGLIGDAVIRESPTAVSAYDAIPVQAGAALANKALIPAPGGALEFDRFSYQAVTGKIIGSVHYDSSTATSTISTSLILLTLDTLSNRPNYPVFVDLNFYNEFEVPASESTTFFCFEETQNLNTAFGLNAATFGTKGLVESIKAVKTPFVGIADTAGPVTLLGLVITREIDPATGTLLRHYTLPFYNDSKPVDTDFVY